MQDTAVKFARGDRVMTAKGYAGTLAQDVYAENIMVGVTMDYNGRLEYAESDSLTKLAVRDEREAVRGGAVAPRAWTMGGRVD